MPTGRLDALYSTRLTPTIQALVAAISDPRSNIPSEFRGRNADPSNLMINVQHDIGKWCTEYTWSAEDGMLGVRVLHNFGRLGTTTEVLEDSLSLRKRAGVKRVDEEDAVEGGLKGRMSIGAEIYFSAKERSAGGRASILSRSYADNFYFATSLFFFSFDWNSLHNFARLNSSVSPSAHATRCIFNVISRRLSHASGTAFATSNNDYCSLQSNAWAYV